MQSNISTCKALNHWKASVIACGFVNKLLPRTEKTEFLVEDKEGLENSQSDTGLTQGRNQECKTKTKPPRMGRMKKTPMRVGPGLVGNNHPSKLTAMELSADQNNGHWNAQHYPPSIKIPHEPIDSYPQTSTPKYGESKDPSRPTSEHSSSSMSEQSFKSDCNMDDSKLVIVTEKAESPWMSNDLKPNCMMTTNQDQRPWISSDLHTTQARECDKERVKAATFSFGDSQMGSGESIEVGNQEKDELDSSMDGGKPIRATKIMRCKQCDTEHVGKENLWQHLRDVHPKENHLLCDYCPFATRYRHHYEYHIRNHRGEKPFKCEQCGYRCVNKSMLASHMKSHTTIYEYKCDTCSYETKYYHSLKQHLEKTNHFSSPEKTGLPKKLISDSPCDRGNDLSPNGNMLPMPSGPPLSMLNGVNLLPPPPPLHNPFSQNVPDRDVATSGQMLVPANFQPPFLSSPAKSSSFPLMNHSASAIVGSLVPNPSIAMQIQNTMSLLYSEGRKLAGMDQAQSLLQDAILASHLVDVPSDLSVPQQQPKRKTIKTEQLVDREEGARLKVDSFGKRESSFDINSNDDKILEASRNRSGYLEKPVTPSSGYDEEISLANLSYCKYCKVYFVDPVAYQVHAGNHNFDDPFKCNRCGHRAKDAISFMSHGLCSKQ